MASATAITMTEPTKVCLPEGRLPGIPGQFQLGEVVTAAE